MFVGYQCVFVRQAESGGREHEGEIGDLAPSKRRRLRQKAKIAEVQVPMLNEAFCVEVALHVGGSMCAPYARKPRTKLSQPGLTCHRASAYVRMYVSTYVCKPTD